MLVVDLPVLLVALFSFPPADLAALPASSAPRTLLRIAKARPVGDSET